MTKRSRSTTSTNCSGHASQTGRRGRRKKGRPSYKGNYGSEMVPKGRAGQVLDCTTAKEKVVWRSPWVGQHPTVFQAEVFIILHCAETLLSEKVSGRCISICSDRQAAIRAVWKPEISSILVWNKILRNKIMWP